MNRKEYQPPRAEVIMAYLQTTLLEGSEISIPANPSQSGIGGPLSPQYEAEMDEDF